MAASLTYLDVGNTKFDGDTSYAFGQAMRWVKSTFLNHSFRELGELKTLILSNAATLKLEPVLSGLGKKYYINYSDLQAYKNGVQTLDFSGVKLNFAIRGVQHNDFIDFFKRCNDLKAISFARSGIQADVLADLMVFLLFEHH